jgi:hypothetical protein
MVFCYGGFGKLKKKTVSNLTPKCDTIFKINSGSTRTIKIKKENIYYSIRLYDNFACVKMCETMKQKVKCKV